MYKKIIFNKPALKLRRKELRKRQTNAEEYLWTFLRGKKLGYKFFRQYSVGTYILDFYCPQKRLAIELDGGIHESSKNRELDDYRTRTIGEFNIKVVRFWISDVLEQAKSTLEAIRKHLM